MIDYLHTNNGTIIIGLVAHYYQVLMQPRVIHVGENGLLGDETGDSIIERRCKLCDEPISSKFARYCCSDHKKEFLRHIAEVEGKPQRYTLSQCEWCHSDMLVKYSHTSKKFCSVRCRNAQNNSMAKVQP